MSEILPKEGEGEIEIDDPRIVDLGSEEAEIVLDSLSSKTTREVFLHIYEEPSTKSQIASEFENSIQNIKYHIDKLEESNLIEKKRTDYSEKGTEMDVYGPTHEAVILLAADEDIRSKIQESIKPIGATILTGTIISASLMQLVTTSTEERDLSIDDSDTNGDNKDGVGIESQDSVGTDSVSNQTDATVETAENIIIGFFEVSPSVGIAIVMFIGILIGSLTYFTIDRL